MKIHIILSQRLLSLVCLSICIASTIAYGTHTHAAKKKAHGGNEVAASLVTVEDETRQLRAEQFIRKHREDILRRQILGLEEQKKQLGSRWNETYQQAYMQSSQELLDLLKDSRKAEAVLLDNLRQMWETTSYMKSIALGTRTNIQLAWPVAVQYGLSATYSDAGYKRRFGFEHGAVDIPVEQGTTIKAAESGIVSRVSDNGMGYSSLTIDHGGTATLYGHILEFLIQEGDFVYKGQPIAKSGGMPGTKGAGHISTGPHVHLEVWKNGERVDPLEYLPEL